MELPARIGKYELHELLGGGMSRVYRARDTVIGRTVVVKILTEQACREPEAKARFLREAQVAGNITHDNVISVYDFGEEQGRPYMVMEFLRGEDLRNLIKTGRTGDLHRKVEIALQLARALEHIHSQKIVHRDIKPENIQVTTAGVVKLMDFGIAKAQDSSLTRPGFTLGTPYYMAPKQVRGLPLTHLVDIYAFGVLLFELLTGVRPTEGDTVERIFYQILYQPLDLKPLETAGVPQPLADLVVRCTAKDPAQRSANFSAVCAELERILRLLERGEEVVPETAPTPVQEVAAAAPAPAPEPVAMPQPAAAPKTSRWSIVAAAAGLLMFIAATYIYFQPTAAKPPKTPPTLVTTTGEMVLVPAGPFLSGREKTNVALPAFYIDKTEVTNEAYARFCADKGRSLPEHFLKDRPNFPVVNIAYLDALEFARWAGKRLPTMLEWEKAARGPNGFPFPWGNQPDASRANVQGNGNKNPDLMPVASFQNGASPSGALNMAGNVWEYVDEMRAPTADVLKNFSKLLKPAPTAQEPWYAIRGGAYDTPLSDRILWDATTVPARYHAANIGFRCAKNAQ